MLTQYSVFLYAECVNALGMESGAISDGQMTASSQYSSSYAARLSRLHLKASGGYSGGWISRYNNQNQWLMVDMGHQNTIVTAVATQGRDATNQWVKTYKLPIPSVEWRKLPVLQGTRTKCRQLRSDKLNVS